VTGNSEYKRIDWVKWHLIATLKYLGVRKLKDIHMFGQFLVKISLWNVITKIVCGNSNPASMIKLKGLVL